MCAGVMISLNRFRSSLISLFSTAVRKVDAPLIVLVCELSASRSLLIDAINPSVIGYRGTRFRVCHWRYNSDCQSLVKKDLETKKNNIARYFIVYCGYSYSFFFHFPVRRMKICRVKKEKETHVCAYFNIFSTRNQATRDPKH